MDMDMEGRTAVVTGASKGIGLAVTRALTDAGAHVVAGARTRSGELKELVWRRGYAETSLQDLLKELSIGSGSLYAAFGSKEELYARALERYCALQAGSVVKRLETATEIRPAVRQLLTDLIETDLADPSRGCLLVNAATERGDDPATVDRVARTLD